MSRTGFKVIATLMVLLVLAAYAVMFLPRRILTPNKEASMGAYYDAKRVFNETETREYSGGESYTQTYTGACPDLSMETSKALADKKLTISEVYHLHQRAQWLHDEADRISSINEALAAAGRPLLKEKAPQCSSGDELFNQFDH